MDLGKLLLALGVGMGIYGYQNGWFNQLFGGGNGTGNGSGSGTGNGNGGGTGNGSGNGTGNNTGGTGGTGNTGYTYNIPTYTAPTIPVQATNTAQETAAQQSGYLTANDLIRANSAMRRGLIPDGSTPEYYYQWLQGSHVNGPTILAALGGDPLSQAVVVAGNIKMGWDEWNSNYGLQTGYSFPPSAMDLVPGDRWGQVDFRTYWPWAESTRAAYEAGNLSGLGKGRDRDMSWYWM